MMSDGLDINKLPEQFKTAAKFKGMLRAFLSPMVDLETHIINLPEDTSLDNAFGKTLDLWGEIAGEPRRGRGDEAYRIAIKIRIQANLASGGSDTIVQIIQEITKSPTVIYQDFFPGSYAIFANGLGSPNLALIDGTIGDLIVNNDDKLILNGEPLVIQVSEFLSIKQLLLDTKPAGIGDIEYSFHTDKPTTETFGFGDGTRQDAPILLNSEPLILSSGNTLATETDFGAQVPPYNFGTFSSVANFTLLLNGEPIGLDFGDGDEELKVFNENQQLLEGRWASAFVI